MGASFLRSGLGLLVGLLSSEEELLEEDELDVGLPEPACNKMPSFQQCIQASEVKEQPVCPGRRVSLVGKQLGWSKGLPLSLELDELWLSLEELELLSLESSDFLQAE